MPKRHDHAWLTFAFALDHIKVYYCGYCLYANFILLVLGTLIFWLFSFIIALLFPGYITSVSVTASSSEPIWLIIGTVTTPRGCIGIRSCEAPWIS